MLVSNPVLFSSSLGIAYSAQLFHLNIGSLTSSVSFYFRENILILVIVTTARF